MRILLAAHGYPPELLGGTENALAALARALAARGHDVGVVAGSLDGAGGPRLSRSQDSCPGGPSFPVWRVHRGDLYFDHWQKSKSAHARRLFGEVLEEFRPDVVHVHHWIRLSRDLVAAAARRGVPAVVSLHDLWTTCLIAFRVRPDTRAFCDAPLGPNPCLACAQNVPPRTPFVPADQARLMLAERVADTTRELSLARAVLVPSLAHGRAIERFLGRTAGWLTPCVVPPARDLELARRAPLAPRAPGEPLVLAAWGHLAPLKGYDLVLEALAGLPEGAKVRLEIAGGEVDPQHGELLRRRAAELPNGIQVRFHGPYRPEDLAAHPIAAAHLMVSGTRAHESWGLVLDEAIALGLPALVPAAGALLERLEAAPYARMYRSGDGRDLAARIVEFLDRPGLERSLADALPAAGEGLPSLEEHVEATLAAYADAVSAGAPQVPPEPWFAARMESAAEENWDRALSSTSGWELGFEPAPTPAPENRSGEGESR